MRFLIVLGLSCCLVFMAQAAEIRVKEIEVTGLQRISLGTVLNNLSLEQGDLAGDAELGEAIRSLYSTGYFKDILLFTDLEGNLRFDVIEQPAVESLEFEGNRQIDTSTLESVFSAAGIEAGEVFNQASLDSLVVELKRQYASLGRYGAVIETELTPLPSNRVRLNINIKEGSKARISDITITGNNAFSESQLLGLLRSREHQRANFLHYISKRTQYSAETLRADQDRLAAWYLDNGYLRYELNSTQVSVSSDLERVQLTMNISEGDQYRVSELNVLGNLVGDNEYLTSLGWIEPGSVFSRQQLTQKQQALLDRLSELGYAFANIRIRNQIDDENKTISLDFIVEPGLKTYVRHIYVRGNETTQDEVLRREMVQFEGAQASSDAIAASRRRLERLGYFRNVRIDTNRVAGADDLVDLVVKVEEMKDATITGSIGYADPGGLFVAAEYKQKNFQGSGKDVELSITSNSYQKDLNFSYRNPYFTNDGVSFSQNVFFNETDNSDISDNDYATNKWGGGISFGYPTTINQRLSLGLDFTYTSLFANNPAKEISNFINTEGDEFSNLELRTGWNYSTLNGSFLATRGQQHGITLNTTIPGSDLSYYKIDYRGRFYQPLIADSFVLRYRAGLAYGNGFGEDNALPFFENFRSGGVSSVRGFGFGSLGPKSEPASGSLAEPAALGGNMKVEYGVDLIFPTPLAKDQTQFRSSLFLDAGNVFTDNCLSTNTNCQEGFDAEDIRYSAGFELDWMTPIAPLRFIWSKPLNATPDDQTQTFTFTFGYMI